MAPASAPTINLMSVSVLAEIDAQYRQLREESAAARRAGLKVIEVSGTEAGEYLQSQVTNDLDPVEIGQGVYAALLDRKARVQADMRILRIEDHKFLLLLEAECFDAAYKHLDMYKIGRQVEIDAPSGLAVISVLGPATEARTELKIGPAMSSEAVELGGISCRAISAPLGGLPGVDLVLAGDDVERLLSDLAGRGIPEVTEEALEILRIEAGLPRYGHEITTAVMPAETGIVATAVSFEKGCYIGQEPVARLHYRGRPNRMLRRLILDRPVAEGATLSLGDRELGVLTSSCVSPARGPLGLAVVRKEAEPGSTIDVGDGAAEAVVEAVEASE